MKYSLQDLLTNPEFRRFTLNPLQGSGEFWLEWKEQSEENRRVFNEARSLIRDFYEPLSADEFQDEAIEFKRRIDVTRAEKDDIISLYESRRPKKAPWMRRLAAAIALLISAAVVMGWFLNKNHMNDSDGLNTADNMLRKEAGRGQKLTIMLQDGTKVKLNSESYIIYPKEFDKNVREVVISGEAYFDVVHYNNWPFVVKSKDVQTKVLGTSFNVMSYPDEKMVQIALVEGNVQVSTRDKPTVLLKPMEMASVVNEGEEIEISPFDLDKVTAWKDNRLVFKEASFEEVESRLGRWFNVDFVYDKGLVFEGGYKGDFSKESLKMILEGMSANKFDYKIEGKKVYIY